MCQSFTMAQIQFQMRNQTGDMNSTASSDDVDSKRVEVVWLAAESQHMLPKKHDQTLVEVSVEHEKSTWTCILDAVTCKMA